MNHHQANIPARIDRRSFLTSTEIAAAGLLLPGALTKGFAASVGQPASTVTIRSGKVRGRLVDGVHTFKGIPYGAPTGGANRFMPPQPLEPWAGVREAFESGCYAPQSDWKPKGPKQGEYWSLFSPPDTAAANEDCLNLDVWTRGINDGGRRPVMVWIHGGGTDHGNGIAPGYDGDGLARHQDVVMVTLNHRLGVLGYLFLGDVGGPGFESAANVGQLDLVAALQWVRDNISAFGGDPNKVLIYGQSGGGAKISKLMGMPGAQGLFQRAAIQSGAGGSTDRRAVASKSAGELLASLGLRNGRELQRVPLDKLIAASSSGKWKPVVDGTVLPAEPFDPVAMTLSADVPVIVGTTRTESTAGEVDNPGYGQLDEAGLLSRTQRLVGDSAEKIIETYRHKSPKATPYELAVNIRSDADMLSSIRLAERRAALGRAPTYLYVFAWETPVMGLRAPHAAELPFVFNHIDASARMVGPVTPPMKTLEAATAGAWAALARGGDPNHAGLPAWPPYTPASRATMIFDAPCRVENDPVEEVRKIVGKRA